MTGSPTDVLAAVVAHGLLGTTTRFPRTPLADVEWNALGGAVWNERAYGLLAAAVSDGALPATAEQAEQAHEAHVGAMCNALLLESWMLEIVERLRGEDIAACV